jgi:alkylated DNA repair dioxygenase AlkB
MADLPDGLIYEPTLFGDEEERRLLDRLADVEFDEIRMHGVVAKRGAKHYGFDDDFERRRAVPDAEPIPDWLQPARAKAAELAGTPPGSLVEALVLHYPAGAQIGWHRDAPMFGTVVGISLLSPARMRFRRGRTGAWETAELVLEPGSGYVLTGEARTAWQHHVPPAGSERYSLTFRTLRKPVSSGP